jgi:hypothetical protein
VTHFDIGFGRAGETPAAKGSGVLIRFGEVHGILTCAHVDKYLRELKQPVGLVRFNQGPTEQYGTLDMWGVDTYAADVEPWTGDDIAFIHLPRHLVGNITARGCVFLHSVFGLVEEFTGETTRQQNRATTQLRGRDR